LEDQPRPVLWVTERDRPPVMNEHRRHSHSVDVDPGFAAIDGDPLIAVEVQHHQGRNAGSADTVELDVRATVEADGDVATRGKDVSTRTEPDDQGDAERCRRHSYPLSRPISRVESPLSSSHGALIADRRSSALARRRRGRRAIEMRRVAG
jgi:hypothetical protein